MFLLSNLVQGELFDLGEKLRLHVSYGDALFGDLDGGGEAGEVFVLFDVSFDFGEWRQRVIVGEDVVGPAGGFDDDLLGLVIVPLTASLWVGLVMPMPTLPFRKCVPAV
jgi:hypothetical protein